MSVGQLVARGNSLLDQEGLYRVQPLLIIRGAQIARRRHPLDRMADRIDIGYPSTKHSVQHREDPFLPVSMKHWLVLFPGYRAKAMHPAKIMDAVHRDSLAPLAC